MTLVGATEPVCFHANCHRDGMRGDLIRLADDDVDEQRGQSISEADKRDRFWRLARLIHGPIPSSPSRRAWRERLSSGVDILQRPPATIGDASRADAARRIGPIAPMGCRAVASCEDFVRPFLTLSCEPFVAHALKLFARSLGVPAALVHAAPCDVRA